MIAWQKKTTGLDRGLVAHFTHFTGTPILDGGDSINGQSGTHTKKIICKLQTIMSLSSFSWALIHRHTR